MQKAEKIDNYYGFENGVSGNDLYKAGINQAKNLDIDVFEEEVIKIEVNNKVDNNSSNNIFKVITSKNVYESKNIIIAARFEKKYSQYKRN